MIDRRFGRSVEFLFLMLDYMEKKDIHSAQRFVLPIRAGRVYTRADVHDGQRHYMNTVSLVPHTVRSSRAYKKKHGMHLFNMFLKLGSPQLVMTVTCNDFAPEYIELLEGGRPWDDTVLFKLHFKRIFQHWFNRYILKSVSLSVIWDKNNFIYFFLIFEL